MALISQIAAGARGLSSAKPVINGQPIQGSSAATQRGLSSAAPVVANLPVHGFANVTPNTPPPTTNGLSQDQLKTQAAQEYAKNGSISPATRAYLQSAGIGDYDPTSDENYQSRQTASMGTPQQPLDIKTGTTASPTTSLNDILAGIDKSAANMNANGNNVSTQDVAAQKQAAIAKYQAEQQAKQATFQNQQKADQTGGSPVQSSAAPTNAGATNVTQQPTPTIPQNSQNTGGNSTSGPSNTSQGANTTGGASGGQVALPPTAFTQPAGTPEGPPTQTGQGPNAQNTGGANTTGGIDTTGNQPSGSTQQDQTQGADVTNLATLTLPPQLQNLIDPMLKGLSDQYSTAQDMLTSELGNIQKNSDISNLLYQQGSQNALLGFNRSLDLAKQTQQAQKDVIDEQKRSDLATLQNTQDQQDAQFHFAANQQRLANIQNERANRIIGAKEGINVDSGGLDWMQREAQRGQDSLNYIYTQAALADKDIGNKMLNTINTWGNNMEQLDAQTAQQYGQAYSSYVSAIQDLGKNRLTDLQSQQKDMTQARQDYMTNLSSIDKTKATIMGTYTTALDAQAKILAQQQYHKDMIDLRKSVMQMQQSHFDTTTYNNMFSKQQSMVQKINSSFSTTNPVIKSYQDGLTYKSSFDTAYNMYTQAQKNGDKGSETAAAAQVAIQFSHYQNSGSLRISDLGATDAVKYQSLLSEWSAKMSKFTDPNIGAPDDVVQGMSELMQKTNDARAKNVQDLINSSLTTVNQWNNSPDIGNNYPDLLISPTDLQIPPGFSAPSNYMNNVQTKYKTKITAPEAGGGSDQSTNEGSTYSSQIPEQGTPSFGSSSPLAQYVNQNGFRVTQYYNGTYDQNHPINGKPIFSDGRPTHESYNISPPNPGQKNVAAPVFQGGQVIQVQHSTKGYGNNVRIKDANGNTWIYGHLASTNVKVGQNVNAGDQLGVMGDTGWATGVTMHLEARGPDGKPFDFAADGSNPNMNIAYNSAPIQDNTSDNTAEEMMLLSSIMPPSF